MNQDRVRRIVKLVTVMTEATTQWDSQRVLSAGMEAEDALSITDCKWFISHIFSGSQRKIALEQMMLESMARAFSRTAEYSKAAEYFERLLKLRDPVVEPKYHTRTLMSIADMRQNLGELDKAKDIYEQVRSAGCEHGNFEFESKACMGLSLLQNRAGKKAEALALAKNALTAAGLMLDGDWSKSRDKAQAIIQIVHCSDIKSKDFNEELLKDLSKLSAAVEKTEEGGSTLLVKAAELQWARHFAMNRWPECGEACLEIMRLAGEPRFKEKADVQDVSKKASQTMDWLKQHGFITMNPDGSVIAGPLDVSKVEVRFT